MEGCFQFCFQSWAFCLFRDAVIQACGTGQLDARGRVVDCTGHEGYRGEFFPIYTSRLVLLLLAFVDGRYERIAAYHHVCRSRFPFSFSLSLCYVFFSACLSCEYMFLFSFFLFFLFLSIPFLCLCSFLFFSFFSFFLPFFLFFLFFFVACWICPL